MKGKRVSESRAVVSQVMQPSDANTAGNVHGGTITKLVDTAGAIAAIRHAGRPVVTVVIDTMTFHEPVFVGNLLTLEAQVNWVGRTSIEVGVKVTAEDLITGRKSHTSSAFVVYVALDENRKPTGVIPLIAESEEEQKRLLAAGARRERRLREAKAGDP